MLPKESGYSCLSAYRGMCPFVKKSIHGVAGFEFDPSPPTYVSEKSAENFRQDHRVFPGRIELRCWVVQKTFVIPAEEIVDVEIRPAFSFLDLFSGKIKLNVALKLDCSDLCEDVDFQVIEDHSRQLHESRSRMPVIEIGVAFLRNCARTAMHSW